MPKPSGAVKWWLLCGVVMIYVQIMLGGITRLTGSGLSITEWQIITGTIPPLNERSWNNEFEKYRETPQYHKLNKGMTLAEFKRIYFWEYLHRLWARLMGFVFAIPFAVFLLRKQLPKRLILQLVVVIFLSALAASFGWIMVKSGLVERPWVDAYKLTMHLLIALLTFSYLLHVTVRQWVADEYYTVSPLLKRFAAVLLAVITVQLSLGGMMSGMKAGFLYPTFPDMNGRFIPDVLLSPSSWTMDAFRHYDADPFAASLVHFLHRMVGYSFLLLVVIFYCKSKKVKTRHPLPAAAGALAGITLIQVVLGIITVLHFKGGLPIMWGVLHQAVGILVLADLVVVFALIRKPYV
ncbi:MAG: heme A synthase [Chitinophagales bacterium]|nr:MAG: heme A synthase [Chitinophagales bacterium]